jgi:hypothetical protein
MEKNTKVKSLLCDVYNPVVNPDNQISSRGRPRNLRAENRSERRSHSAVPYKRQASVSMSRASGNVSVKNSEAVVTNNPNTADIAPPQKRI